MIGKNVHVVTDVCMFTGTVESSQKLTYFITRDAVYSSRVR